MKRVLAIAGVLTAVVTAGLWNVSVSATDAQQQSLTAKFGPHKQANLPPLPFGPGDPLPRPRQVVVQVFQFAAEHPEVLSYIPCFCGCDHAPLGHRGNDDCFVKQRAANGDVVAWEPHGTECQVCIDVGQQAMQMYSSGASVSQIRTAVEKRFQGQYQFHTPTPPPPVKVATPAAQAPAKK